MSVSNKKIAWETDPWPLVDAALITVNVHIEYAALFYKLELH